MKPYTKEDYHVLYTKKGIKELFFIKAPGGFGVKMATTSQLTLWTEVGFFNAKDKCEGYSLFTKEPLEEHFRNKRISSG